MDLQAFVVALIVPACAVYAAWKLAPAALKRGAARRLLGARLPAPVARAVQRTANASGGCGCDGCDAAPPKPTAGATPEAPITLHRRRS